jgi:FixJ family two-component response regulator
MKYGRESPKKMRTPDQNNTKSQYPTNPLICIVDDDVSIADSTRCLVRSAGFRGEAFASAREFLNSTLVEKTACLILDVRMPGMDGLELQDHLARASKRIPIVFITGRANESDENRAMEGGAVAFLRKPFSERALFDAIERALSR